MEWESILYIHFSLSFSLSLPPSLSLPLSPYLSLCLFHAHTHMNTVTLRFTNLSKITIHKSHHFPIFKVCGTLHNHLDLNPIYKLFFKISLEQFLSPSQQTPRVLYIVVIVLVHVYWAARKVYIFGHVFACEER